MKLFHSSLLLSCVPILLSPLLSTVSVKMQCAPCLARLDDENGHLHPRYLLVGIEDKLKQRDASYFSLAFHTYIDLHLFDDTSGWDKVLNVVQP